MAKGTEWLTFVAGGLILVGMLGWGSIFVPVVRAEVGYRLHVVTDGGIRRFLVPSISLQFQPQGENKSGGSNGSDSYSLSIPRVYLTVSVVSGVDAANKPVYMAALKRGVAQAAGTALPGEGGLGYYFAHSSGVGSGPQQTADFYLLGKVAIGDMVYLHYHGQQYAYRVVDKEIVAPNDVSLLHNLGGPERIVLQTCWPIGTDLQRLLVTAKRVI